MKKISLLGSVLYVGILAAQLDIELGTLADSLTYLNDTLTGRPHPVPVPPAPSPVPPAPVNPNPVSPEEDKVTQLLLSVKKILEKSQQLPPDIKIEFDRLPLEQKISLDVQKFFDASDDDKKAILQQIASGDFPGIHTGTVPPPPPAPGPVPPAPPAPEPNNFPPPPPPPAPPAPPAPAPPKPPKPVVRKPDQLTPEEIAQLKDEDKKVSDEFLLTALKNFAAGSYGFLEAPKNLLEALKDQEAFVKGFRIKQPLNELEKSLDNFFTQNLKIAVGQTLEQFLILLSTKLQNGVIQAELLNLFWPWFFERPTGELEKQLLETLQEFAVSCGVAERKKQKKQIVENAKSKGLSDQLFTALFAPGKTVQDVKTGLMYLRINPQYLKYAALQTRAKPVISAKKTGSSRGNSGDMLAELKAKLGGPAEVKIPGKSSQQIDLYRIFSGDIAPKNIPEKVSKEAIQEGAFAAYIFTPGLFNHIDHLNDLLAQIKKTVPIPVPTISKKPAVLPKNLFAYMHELIDRASSFNDIFHFIGQLPKKFEQENITLRRLDGVAELVAWDSSLLYVDLAQTLRGFMTEKDQKQKSQKIKDALLRILAENGSNSPELVNKLTYLQESYVKQFDFYQELLTKISQASMTSADLYKWLEGKLNITVDDQAMPIKILETKISPMMDVLTSLRRTYKEFKDILVEQLKYEKNKTYWTGNEGGRALNALLTKVIEPFGVLIILFDEVFAKTEKNLIEMNADGKIVIAPAWNEFLPKLLQYLRKINEYGNVVDTGLEKQIVNSISQDLIPLKDRLKNVITALEKRNTNALFDILASFVQEANMPILNTQYRDFRSRVKPAFDKIVLVEIMSLLQRLNDNPQAEAVIEDLPLRGDPEDIIANGQTYEILNGSLNDFIKSMADFVLRQPFSLSKRDTDTISGILQDFVNGIPAKLQHEQISSQQITRIMKVLTAYFDNIKAKLANLAP